jgi:Flp pilus assembly protein TadG
MGWLIKIVVVFGILGLIVFEGGSVVLNRLTARDTASKAAQEAGFAYRDSSDQQRAEQAARQTAEAEGTTLVKLEVDIQNRTTTATVRKKAKSIVIHNIGALRKYLTVTVSEKAPFPS